MNNTKKRELIAIVDSELGKFGDSEPASAMGVNARLLKSSFAALVDLLALGPEPETRSCPHCGRRGIKAATICGYCWKPTPQATA